MILYTFIFVTAYLKAMGALLLASHVSRVLLLHVNDYRTIIRKIVTTCPDDCDNMPRHRVSCHSSESSTKNIITIECGLIKSILLLFLIRG